MADPRSRASLIKPAQGSTGRGAGQEWVRNWQLWRLPRPARRYLIAVDTAAVVATIALADRYPVTSKDTLDFLVITGLGVLAAELTRGVERMRRRFSDTPHVNMTSVWMLSAALLVTPALAAITAVVLYLHLWLRGWRDIAGMHPFRTIFSTCVVVLSSHTVFLVSQWAPGPFPPDLSHPFGLAVLVSFAVAYWLVNSVLVALAIALLRTGGSLNRLLGNPRENTLEFATLVVGLFTALALVSFPWATVLVLLPLAMLHRSVLVQQFEHAATTDTKTGLLNAGTWQSLASIELDRASRHGNDLGVLMIDIDHFKDVNRRYNHLIGDQAIRATANVLRDSVRAHDLVGRFGGEEFIILLIDSGHAGSVEVANRICERIRAIRIVDAITGAACPDLRLSVSVGVATYPKAGLTLDEVLMAADNAMFAAKDAGRDQVIAIQSRYTDSHVNRSSV